MMFIEPDVAGIVCKQTKLVHWVFDALRIDDICDYRKQNVVGLLVTLLSPRTSFELGEMGAVDVVVNALLPYTRSSLEEEDEEEEEDEDEEDLLVEEQYFLESLFHCLSSLLSASTNRVRFAEAGGVECMIQIIKKIKLNYEYYGSALVALDAALKDCPCACDKFVDASGLDIAFPASMDIISTCITHDKEDIEKHLLRIIASLTVGIAAETKNKDKLLSKFEENDAEKTTWLMELFIRNLKICARIEDVLAHHNLKKKDVQDILLISSLLVNSGKASQKTITENGANFFEALTMLYRVILILTNSSSRGRI
ncbi:hypothetical protein MKW94_023272 [Papaver nudicaule]|uniref:Beta-catenin-like protein 1 N-terminal domain-containing protein n=1 Tax=Papaver nudicaule TaxID=74823 RepID=A0AA41VSM6_PAPNU|nr:hypothetical protein [Papaver nudicaule]